MRMKSALHFTLIVCRVSPFPTMYISSQGHSLLTSGLAVARTVINKMAKKKENFIAGAAAMVIENV